MHQKRFNDGRALVRCLGAVELILAADPVLVVAAAEAVPAERAARTQILVGVGQNHPDSVAASHTRAQIRLLNSKNVQNRLAKVLAKTSGKTFGFILELYLDLVEAADAAQTATRRRAVANRTLDIFVVVCWQMCEYATNNDTLPLHPLLCAAGRLIERRIAVTLFDLRRTDLGSLSEIAPTDCARCTNSTMTG